MIQNGGAQIIITDGGIEYQGSGVLIINTHTNSKGITEDHVIFFRMNDMNGVYDLPGGRCENDHASIEQTASIELYEESRKTISIKPTILQTLPSVAIDGRATGLRGKFKCYICRVQHISTKIYNDNMSIFDKLISIDNTSFNGNVAMQQKLKDRLKSYLETNKLCRIPVKNIESLLGTTNTICMDDEGILVTLSRQSVRVYMEARRTNKIPKCLPNGLLEKNKLIDLGKGTEAPNDSHTYIPKIGPKLQGRTIYY